LICITTDSIFKWRDKKINNQGVQTYGAFFMMFIYGVFIIAFFGLFANWKNQDITIANLEVLFFKNWFFNLNLIFILVLRVYSNMKQKQSKSFFGAFTPNMIVLHVSIIIGAFLMFFVVKNYPAFFHPNNLLGSVIIISPFLILKVLSQYFFKLNK